MENEALILDLVEWIATGAREYADVMSAWQTSCPRLTIWEDAVDCGYLRHVESIVEVTESGREFLRAHNRAAEKIAALAHLRLSRFWPLEQQARRALRCQ